MFVEEKVFQKINVIASVILLTVMVTVVEQILLINVVSVMDLVFLKVSVIALEIKQIVKENVVEMLNLMNAESVEVLVQLHQHVVAKMEKCFSMIACKYAVDLVVLMLVVFVTDQVFKCI